MKKFQTSQEQNELARLRNVYAQNITLDADQFDADKSSVKNNKSRATTKLGINVHIKEKNVPTKTYSLDVDLLTSTPSDIIFDIICMKLRTTKQYDDVKTKEIANNFKHSYSLRICGLNELLFGSQCFIGSYKYIKACMSENKIPNFYLDCVEKVLEKMPKNSIACNSYLRTQFSKYEEQEKISQLEYPAYMNQNHQVSWNVDKNFVVCIKTASFLPQLADCDKVFFRLALYHGQDLLSAIRVSKHADYPACKWYETIEFNKLLIKNLHRCCKLCIGMYCLSKRKKQTSLFGFMSLNVFDYKGALLTGTKTLHMWPIVENKSFESLSVGQATGQYQNKCHVSIDMEFPNYSTGSQQHIVYANVDEIKNLIRQHVGVKTQDDCIEVDVLFNLISPNTNRLLFNILKKDALAELTEQDKAVLWTKRYDCLKYPNSLPKLLQAVRWSQKDNVIEMYGLLAKWPIIKPVFAIELLHSTYVDIEVRKYAVKCLELSMRDEELLHYLLQLVQTLKNEPYYDNDLTMFLLNRAMRSQRIGFELFWLLKTEMKHAQYKYRFGLILETYCRALAMSIQDLLKQIDVVDKLSSLTDYIRENREDLTMLKNSFLQDKLDKPDYKEALSHFLSPLNQSNLLGAIDPKRSVTILIRSMPKLAILYESFDRKKILLDQPSDQNLGSFLFSTKQIITQMGQKEDLANFYLISHF